MANQRDPKQRITAVWMRDELLGILDKARSSVGRDRSQFIRDAIVEKLKAMGIEVPRTLAYPPDRAEPMFAQDAQKPPEMTPETLKAEEKTKMQNAAKSEKAVKPKPKKRSKKGA